MYACMYVCMHVCIYLHVCVYVCCECPHVCLLVDISIISSFGILIFLTTHVDWNLRCLVVVVNRFQDQHGLQTAGGALALLFLK